MTIDRLRQIVRLRVRSLFASSSVDRELDEELSYHVDRQIEANVASGMTPDAARTAALRAIGGVQQRVEECRDQRGISAIEGTVQDVRHALRVLKRSPAFTTVAIGSLALGLAAFLAIFQLVDAVALKPLPIDAAHELVELRIEGGRGGWGFSASTPSEVTQALWEEMRARQTVLTHLFAWGTETLLLGAGADAIPVRGTYFSGSAFPALRLSAARGRLIAPDDDYRGCPGGAVLSHAFWMSRFGSDASVLGRSITLMQQPFEIIGVAPPQFTGLEVGRGFDVALPLCAAARLNASVERRDFWFLSVMGRLPAATPLTQASEHVRLLSPGMLEATVPPDRSEASLGNYRGFRFAAYPASHGVSRLRRDYQSPLWLLLGMTSLILLLTAVNLAMLMQARADARRREMATLVALGAGRRRLISQTVVESLMLAAAGVVLALPMALASGRAMVLMLTTDREPWHVALTLDWRSVACAAIAAAATSLIFGVMPALQSSRFDLVTVLRHSGRSLTLDRRRLILQRSLVMGQLAMCFVLIYAALIFVSSFRNVVDTDLGFDPNDLTIVSFADPAMTERTLEDRRQFQRRLVDTLASIPGVQSAAAISQVPLSGASWTQAFSMPGSAERLSAKFSYVTPRYFDTLRIAVKSGRVFTDRDTTGAAPVAIVNEAFVRRFMGGDPFRAGSIQTLAEPRYPPTQYDVIGIVADAKYSDAREDSVPIVYVPLDQVPVLTSWKSVLVRTRLPLPVVERAAKTRVAALSAAIRVAAADMSLRLGDRLVRERMLAWLSGAFGVLAVSLAAIGLYGLIAYVSASRRSEIGVRLALGASRADVIAMMLKQTAVMLIAGLAAGVAISLVAGRAAVRLLYQVVPGDPLTLAVAMLLLSGVATIAAVLPAWRASRVDPMSTLRAEGA